MAGGIVVPTFHPPSSRFRAWLLQRLARQWFAKQVSHPGITSLSHSVRRRSLASYPRLASARVRRRSVPEFLSSTAICRSARSIGTLPKYVHVQYALAEEVSNMPRLTVAQPEAVEALMAKVQARAQGHPSWYRLVKATKRAHDRYQQVSTPASRGFFHGLLTGYAVAIKALQGKMTGSR